MTSAQPCISILKNKNPITILIRVFLPAKSGITSAHISQRFERPSLTNTLSVSDDCREELPQPLSIKGFPKIRKRSKQDKGRDGKPALRPPTDQERLYVVSPPACHGAREQQMKAPVTLMSSFHVNQGHRVCWAEEEKERSVDGCGQV